MPSHATRKKTSARIATRRTVAVRNDNQPAFAASDGGPLDPRHAMPVGAALEVLRWSVAMAGASVADYPEEAEAVDRVAFALEQVITGRNPRALAQLDEVDLLTTASILITSVDWPDSAEIAELMGIGAMNHGARGPRGSRTSAAIPMAARARGRRGPLLCRHLRLVP